MRDRRQFIRTVAFALLAAPLTAEALQTGKIYRIGVLDTTPAALNATNLNAFRHGLRELGYVDGRDFLIEYRSADGRPERFPDLATELVRLKVDLILTRGTPAALAAKRTTDAIPVVMATSGDPVGIGLVLSLARPGGNITGQSTLAPELSRKRLELLKEIVPGVSRIAVESNKSGSRNRHESDGGRSENAGRSPSTAGGTRSG